MSTRNTAHLFISAFLSRCANIRRWRGPPHHYKLQPDLRLLSLSKWPQRVTAQVKPIQSSFLSRRPWASSQKMSALLEKETRNEKLQSLLASVTLEERPEAQADTATAAPQDAALYYLAVYVVKKTSMFSNCIGCRATITDPQSMPCSRCPHRSSVICAGSTETSIKKKKKH